MPIVSKPRQIRIDLDPDQGFSVGFSVEHAQSVDENGQKIADLGPHIESVAPDSPMVAQAIADLNAANALALLTYQQEVQRLAGELAATQARLAERQPAPTPAP
jgi:hypothetical protein